ncbi:hypothetical protein JNUCC64_03545 [Streptomyces sp. JNUCC 64]
MDDDRQPTRAYRLKAWRLALLMAVAGGFAFALLGPFINDGERPTGVRLGLSALYLAILAVWFFLLRRSGTFVGPSGIVVRTMFRGVSVDWADVQGFHAQRNPSAKKDNYAPKTIVYVRRPEGKRKQLMYLDSNHVDVEAEVTALNADWERHRPAD